MTKFNVHDLEVIRDARISSTNLKKRIENMVENSGNCRAIVESLNRKTGEYRIVLQGKLET